MQESHQALYPHHLCAQTFGPRPFLIRCCARTEVVRCATAANSLIRLGAAGARRTGTHVAPGYYASGVLPFARGRFNSESARGNAANPYASFWVRTVGGFFLPSRIAVGEANTQGK